MSGREVVENVEKKSAFGIVRTLFGLCGWSLWPRGGHTTTREPTNLVVMSRGYQGPDGEGVMRSLPLINPT